MKRSVMGALAVACVFFAGANMAFASYQFVDSFETGWSGDYAAGWSDVVYRWGDASASAMTQYASGANGIVTISGANYMGLKVTHAGDPVGSTDWWGAVAPSLNDTAMAAEYSPWLSVMVYDNGATTAGAQLAAVPDGYYWTDTQMGTRRNQSGDYWYVEAGANYVAGAKTGWQDTLVSRTSGWHTLKYALDPSGQITYSIDGVVVGLSQGTYTSLVGAYLMTQFNSGGFDNSEVYFDNFQAGSTCVPEPATIIVWSLLGCLGIAVGCWRRWRAA
jgi:hypothetical protein